MSKIINPEECEKTPEEFSEVSRIISIDKEDCRGGIILDSLEDISQALVTYDTGSVVEGASATRHNLMDSVGDKGDGIGAALLLYAGAKNIDFVDRLIKDISSELQSKGSFYESFDYNAIGTNFFKTGVFVDKVEDKYVLGLCAAFVGDEPEENLAEKLGKSRALISSNVKGKISVVDDWWFNLNLENLLSGFPIPKKQLKQLPESLASGFDDYKVDFKHEGQIFLLNIRLNPEVYFAFKKHPKYLQARDNSIVGGAWTTVTEDYRHECPPRPLQPKLTFSISFPEKKGYTRFRNAIVSDEKMEEVKGARDYLAEILIKNK